ncbi:hypothetical protein [Hymenobacter frigidus]|uniref:hypothetical protein n=1 Tax=Hymenobacter frigidus TaxID=1524095 RepID=UPI0016645E10|nr:hypothetical protein [Hymenobacter frigidus]
MIQLELQGIIFQLADYRLRYRFSDQQNRMLKKRRRFGGGKTIGMQMEEYSKVRGTQMRSLPVGSIRKKAHSGYQMGFLASIADAT